MRRYFQGKLGFAAAFFAIALGAGSLFGSVKANAETCGFYNVTGGTKGTDYSFDSKNNILTINSGKAITVSGINVLEDDSSLPGHIVVSGSSDVNLTISSLEIYHMEYSVNEAPIQIDDNYTGTVTITLNGSNILSSAGSPAIKKNGSKSKLILNGSGKLEASVSGASISDTAWPAVIGGDSAKSTANIQIDNGIYTLNSYSGGACIGGGSSATIGQGGSADNIVINGGTVNAKVAPYNVTPRSNLFASSAGAAIGGGGNADAETIYIHGGTINASVTAKDGTSYAGAAIGGGCHGAGKNIVIDGGDKIVAKVNNNTCGSGIGSGYKDVSSTGWTNATSVTISGGFVIASGFEKSAGIGGYGSSVYDDNATITITGGRVEATGGTYAPGIGGGRYSNAKVYISGGNVHAIKGKSAKYDIGLDEDSIERNNKGDYEYTASLQRSEEDKSVVSVQSKTDSSLANTAVEVGITDASGNAVSKDYYGINGMSADKDGTIYVYLPSGYTLNSMAKATESSTKDPAKITPDMKNVKWVYTTDGKSTDYVSGTTKLSANGSTYELNVSNLPEGVKVQKYITVKNETGLENTGINNTQKDAGIYKTTVTYAVTDESKYNIPDPMEVVWTIEASNEIKTSDGKQYTITNEGGDSSESGNGSEATVAYNGQDNKTTTSVKVPDTVTVDGKKYKVTEIKAGAFANNKKLKKITIGKNITKIGDKAFYKCTNLTTVVIPSKVTKIGKNAFYGCKKLKTITIKSKKLKSVGKNAIKGINKKATIKCPTKKLAKNYKKKLFTSKTGYKKTMKIK